MSTKATPTKDEFVDLGMAFWRIIQSERPTEVVFVNKQGQRRTYIVTATRHQERETH